MASAQEDPIAAAAADFDSVKTDIVSLRDDLRSLAGHLKTGAVNGVSGEANRLYERLAEQGGRSVGAVSRRIEEQPMLSILLAFAAGFVGGRLLRR